MKIKPIWFVDNKKPATCKKQVAVYIHGGNVWESNSPEKLLTPHTGFEDQRAHQNPSAPVNLTNNIDYTEYFIEIQP